jgi:hypothetical protein
MKVVEIDVWMGLFQELSQKRRDFMFMDNSGKGIEQGDNLVLKEFTARNDDEDRTPKYSGNQLLAVAMVIQDGVRWDMVQGAGYGMPPGFCVMQISVNSEQTVPLKGRLV